MMLCMPRLYNRAFFLFSSCLFPSHLLFYIGPRLMAFFFLAYIHFFYSTFFDSSRFL